jgi:hypothetical protein
MMFPIIALLLAAPAARAAPPGPALQLSDEAVEREVQTLLNNIDTRNLAGSWKALGPRAADLLEPVAQSATELPSRRAKAVEGLVLAAPDRAAAVVTKLATDDAQPKVVRMAALRGVQRTVPPDAAAKSVGKVLRTARDPAMRGLAAEVIAASGSSGCAEVKAQVAREEPDLRFAYGRALAQCKE